MRVYRYSSGLIFDEQFYSLGPEWNSTDPANTTIENGSLKLTHSFLRDVSILRDIPDEAGAFEAVVNYTPTVINDHAGLLLFNSSIETAELLESEDANLANLENIKIIKNENAFDLYMKRNESFEFIDAASYPFSKIGFIVKQGNGSGFVPLLVDRFIATKNDKLKIRNLYTGYRVELQLESNIFVATVGNAGIVEFTLPHLITGGILRIFDEFNHLIGEKTTEFVGGDIYYYGSFLELRKDGVPLSEVDPNDIGNIGSGILEEKLELYNPTSFVVTNVQIQVKQYLSEFGYEWADIAADESGVSGIYSDILSIQELQGQTSVPFWVKIEQGGQTDQQEIFFSIEIEHD
ncbi:hypothetical protein [Bacillus sp. FJAT-52991]|uniref:Cell adhesion protein n=1 Tax=Bacillus kandeliae TaxID=3129297 RepID=A0ABZ2N2S5_9BACI